MNEVRDGRCGLSGDALEMVFKATGLLRTMLDSLGAVCEADVEVAPHAEAPALLNVDKVCGLNTTNTASPPVTPERRH